jgi:hypothetical protein
MVSVTDPHGRILHFSEMSSFHGKQSRIGPDCIVLHKMTVTTLPPARGLSPSGPLSVSLTSAINRYCAQLDCLLVVAPDSSELSLTKPTDLLLPSFLSRNAQRRVKSLKTMFLLETAESSASAYQNISLNILKLTDNF